MNHSPQELLRRLEEECLFECEAGPLTLCKDWHDLKDAVATLQAKLEAARTVRPLPTVWARSYNEFGEMWSHGDYRAFKMAPDGQWHLSYRGIKIASDEFLQNVMVEKANAHHRALVLSSLEQEDG